MFGIVILNYVNYEETIASLNSLSDQEWFNDVSIAVVENGSGNESESILRLLQSEIKFELIVSPRNLGFSGGANLGITHLRNKGCSYIIELNSDARICQNQPHFIKTIKEVYESDKSLALITPHIFNLDLLPQNPLRKKRFGMIFILGLYFFFLIRFDKVYRYLRINVFYEFVNLYVAWRNSRRIKYQTMEIPESDYIYAALGSCQVLTPTFFEHFEGHDNSVFLYCEEYILAEHLYEKCLGTWLENSVSVMHRESKSVEAITNNHREKVSFLLDHMAASGRVLSKILFKNLDLI